MTTKGTQRKRASVCVGDSVIDLMCAIKLYWTWLIHLSNLKEKESGRWENVLICVYYTLIRQLAPKKQMIHSLWWQTLILALFLFWCRSGLSRVCVCVCPFLAFLPFYLKLNFFEACTPFSRFFFFIPFWTHTHFLSLSLSHTHTQNPLLRFIFCVRHIHIQITVHQDQRKSGRGN